MKELLFLSLHEDKKDTNKLLTDILNENPDSLTRIRTLSFPLKEISVEHLTISNTIKKNNSNISKTADFIGMERSALHRKLKSLGIKGLN